MLVYFPLPFGWPPVPGFCLGFAACTNRFFGGVPVSIVYFDYQSPLVLIFFSLLDGYYLCWSLVFGWLPVLIVDFSFSATCISVANFRVNC